MKFGFIGLGQMGAPMALNLAKQSSVIAYDRDVKIVNDGHRSSFGSTFAYAYKRDLYNPSTC